MAGRGPGEGAPLTLPPEAEAPLRGGNPAILVGVAGVEEGADADFVLVQIDGSQLGLVQEEVGTGIQLGEHPADGVLAAGPQALVQPWGEGHSSDLLEVNHSIHLSIHPSNSWTAPALYSMSGQLRINPTMGVRDSRMAEGPPLGLFT